MNVRKRLKRNASCFFRKREKKRKPRTRFALDANKFFYSLPSSYSHSCYVYVCLRRMLCHILCDVYTFLLDNVREKMKTHYMTLSNNYIVQLIRYNNGTKKQTNTAVIKRIHAFGLSDEVRTFLNFNLVPNGVSHFRNTCAMINISHRPMLGLLKEVSESAFICSHSLSDLRHTLEIVSKKE